MKTLQASLRLKGLFAAASYNQARWSGEFMF